MAKRQAGIPDGFELDIEDDDFNEAGPVQLGDFLEEEDVSRVVAVSPKPKRVKKKTAKVSPPEEDSVIEGGVSEDAPQPKRRRPQKELRTNVHVSREILELLSSITRLCGEIGAEPTLKNSEVVEGAILALYEARGQIDLSGLRPRGRWGSPTAKAIPFSLREAFTTAIAKSTLQDEEASS